MPTCSRCGTPNKIQARFCFQCGSLLPTIQPSAYPPDKDRQLKRWLIPLGIVFAIAYIAALVSDKNKSSEPTNSATATIAATPTPLPEMPASPTDKLSQAKALVKGQRTRDDYTECIRLLTAIPKDAKEYKEAQGLLKTAQASLSKLSSDEAKLGPKPENSQYDGSVECVDLYLREVLNDYHDSEYLEWSPVVRLDLKGQPYWAVRLKLRARNGFGAKIVKNVLFFIQQNRVVKAVNL